MDLFTVIGACLRRWYLTVPLLALALLFSYRAYAAVEPMYTSSQSIVVLPSLEQEGTRSATQSAQSTSEPVNPYAGQGGSRFAVAVLTRNLNGSAFKESLHLDPGVEQSFEANSSDNQPMIHITAAAPSEAQVHALLDQIVGQAAVVLDQFQSEAGAPEITRYRIAPAVPVGPVTDATPSRLRAAGAIGVLGGGLTAALVVGLDALLNSRRRRRTAVVDSPGYSADVSDRPLDPKTSEARAESQIGPEDQAPRTATTIVRD